MESEKRKPSGREKDKASIKLLDKLREQLYASGASTRRQAAFNLSWMQEDGLDILKEALFGGAPKRTKTAAAYGLRSMRGRMKKMALEVLEEGLKHRDSGTRDVCKTAVMLLTERARRKARAKPAQARKVGKFEIKDIPKRPGTRGKVGRPRTQQRKPTSNKRPP
jgi:hypothetical protein